MKEHLKDLGSGVVEPFRKIPVALSIALFLIISFVIISGFIPAQRVYAPTLHSHFPLHLTDTGTSSDTLGKATTIIPTDTGTSSDTLGKATTIIPTDTGTSSDLSVESGTAGYDGLVSPETTINVGSTTVGTTPSVITITSGSTNDLEVSISNSNPTSSALPFLTSALSSFLVVGGTGLEGVQANIQFPVSPSIIHNYHGLQILRFPTGGTEWTPLPTTSGTGNMVASTPGFSHFVLGGILNNGGGRSPVPPSLAGTGTNDTTIEINGVWYTLGQLSSEITAVVVNTGQQMSLTVKLYDSTGPQNISHVGLYTAFSQKIDNPAYSNTAIAYDISGNSILNTDGNIKSYSITTSTADNVLSVTFNINFAKAMGTQDVVLRYWNIYGESQDTVIPHALNIVGTTAQPSTPANTPSTPANDLLTSVKEWAGYSPTAISDSQLLQSMGYQGNHVPTWVMRNVAKYLVDGTITQDDFAGVIKYLVDNHLIK